MIGRDNPEINPITIKPETVSHVAEHSSWVPLHFCSPPGCPFPIKSLALSACVSPQTIHFRVSDKSLLSCPGRGSPFLQHINIHGHTMEYYSAIKRNEVMPFAATWMDLEIIILSKVSQKEKINTI